MRVYREIILASWIVWACYWVVASMFAKRVIERQSVATRLLHLAAMVVAFELLFNHRLPFGDARGLVVPQTRLFVLLGTTVCLLGLAFTFWARHTLGGNWSGTVTFKQDHELVQRGPYRFVRHPIYTGVLAMVLGSAVVWDTTAVFGGFVVVFVGLWVKSKQEEAMMTKHFPDAYPPYKARVKGIVPYVF